MSLEEEKHTEKYRNTIIQPRNLPSSNGSQYHNLLTYFKQIQYTTHSEAPFYFLHNIIFSYHIYFQNQFLKNCEEAALVLFTPEPTKQ